MYSFALLYMAWYVQRETILVYLLSTLFTYTMRNYLALCLVNVPVGLLKIQSAENTVCLDKRAELNSRKMF